MDKPVYQCMRKDCGDPCQDRRKTDLTNADIEDAFETSLNRWLDKKFMTFGKWTAIGAAAALFVFGIKMLAKAGFFE